MKDTIGQKNPLRYRGYYYDSETGFYYLQSRYYDPVVQRFINADGYVSTGQGLLGCNMFAYCENNPINRSDLGGDAWKDIKNWFSKTWKSIKKTTKKVAKKVTDWCVENVNATGNYDNQIGETTYFLFGTYEDGVGYSKDLCDEKTVNFYASANEITLKDSSEASIGMKVNFTTDFGMSIESGLDNSIGIHTKNLDIDLGLNVRGRAYLQISTPQEEGYSYERFSLNTPEIVCVCVACYYCPYLIPAFGSYFSRYALVY